jgi:tetratricopeptide (TPR) repeat protein
VGSLDPAPDRPGTDERSARARAVLANAVDLDRAGRTLLAEREYQEAAGLGRAAAAGAVESEALRRMAVIRHHAGDSGEARRFGRASLAAARTANDTAAMAQSLNVLAGVALERGELGDARRLFEEARNFAGGAPEVVAKIEANLGIVANVEGDHDLAGRHFGRALELYRQVRDDHGVAIALHNLGMINADRREFRRAQEQFEQALTRAVRSGDLRLQAVCRLSRAEVLLESEGYDEAAGEAERAQVLFSQLGSVVEEADVYRVLGAIFRRVGQLRIAESNLLAACAHARTTGAALTEAESLRELGRLRVDQGRSSDAAEAFRQAGEVFGRIGAKVDVADVESSLAAIG